MCWCGEREVIATGTGFGPGHKRECCRDACQDAVPEGSTHEENKALTGRGRKVSSVHPGVQMRQGGVHLESLEAFLLFYILVQL